MALYITYEDRQERTWQVGQTPPDGWLTVKHIQADGCELWYIQKQYEGKVGNGMAENIYSIPIPNNQREVRWCGDIAKMIVANL